MATAKPRWIYSFGKGKAEGRGDQKELLGGKGAGLAEMTRIGLPVPAGFTITTEACAWYHRHGRKWPTGLKQQLRTAVRKLERACGKKLGDRRDPLLVSVRSGAAQSMPGMMETILNLGLNDASLEGLARVSGNRRFALDAYRRFIMMYGSIVCGIARDRFEERFERVKAERTRLRLGKPEGERILDTEVNESELETVVQSFKNLYREQTGSDFPQDPQVQLEGAVSAVFDSWMAEKAVTYRRVENITGLAGTAVNVVQMVFGNMGEDSGTGVCFTRDPSTGEPVFYGDLLINAQGEDVVAGIRTPVKLDQLRTEMPEVYDQLEAVRAMLEVHYQDMQDLEFTIERGKLYMLQCRVGKRSPVAAFRIAVDQATKGLMTRREANRLVKKGYLSPRYAQAACKPIITKDQAIARIKPEDIERLFYPVVDQGIPAEELSRRRLGAGIGAVPGASCGKIVFTAADAESRAKKGDEVILVRKETSPEDVGGMHAAVGILTATGGKTSHAAVVARGWGKCCIVGCDALSINDRDKTLSLNGRILREGEEITLDGSTGEIYEGALHLVQPEAPPEYDTLMRWCDRRRRLKIRANADTPQDALKAVELGAEGIGLCRTEHMFFDSSQPQRLVAMREMILADSDHERRVALDKLRAFQKEDFEGIFAAMHGKPVTVRLLDPPLHEFLPRDDNVAGQQAVLDELNRQRGPDLSPLTLDDLRRRINQLHEANPMLGHRGCRLCITFPEILDMQVRAIIEAALECRSRGTKVLPEIMIPLSMDDKELSLLIDRARSVADAVLKEHRAKLNYQVGTMIETPRAALLAGRMADAADFFSFGTNDLTQLVMGLSRDDAARFLPDYLDEHKAGVFARDPFQSIDVEGVGALVRAAVEAGRSTKPKLKIGVCGEHGGDAFSIRFFESVGMDYVSCSPLRVPIARLAAAQAAIQAKAVRPRILKANAKPKSAIGRPSARLAARKTRKKSGRKTTARRTKRSTRAKR